MFGNCLVLSLVFALLLSGAPLGAVQAAADSVLVRTVPQLAFGSELVFEDPSQAREAFLLENRSGYPVDVTVEVYDLGLSQTVQTLVVPLADETPVPVDALVWRQLLKAGESNTYRIRFTSGGRTHKTLYFAQKLSFSKAQEPIYHMVVNAYYPNNTVSSFGPHFRDLTPELTDLWYTVTPVDLSVQGRQTFALTASNMFIIGEVHVDVYEDTVLVTYRYFHAPPRGNTEALEEYLMFYGAYDDIRSVVPEEAPSPFAFEVPFSVRDALAGDTNVLMFIRNRVNYFQFPAPGAEHRRMWENSPENKALREEMLLMMDPISPR